MILIMLLAILVSYCIGSLSSAIIVCHIMRLPDPRTQGSMNPGTTNVLRIGGKWPACITLLGDALKGFVPVFTANLFALNSFYVAFIIVAVVLGHLFPIFFRFQGGKGVATFLGTLLATFPLLGLFWIFIWALITFIFRYVSVASIVASILVPFEIILLTKNINDTLAYAFLVILIIYRHRNNMKHLLQGRENKI